MNHSFKRAYIEISNRCNLACKFCAVSYRAKNDMTSAQFLRCASQVATISKHVYLHVLGEPLLHPEFGEILTIAKNLGLQVNLTTNGTLISQNIKWLTGEYLRKISISVHSFDGMYVDIDGYVEPIAMLIRNRGNMIVELRTWVDSPFNDTLLGILAARLDITIEIGKPQIMTNVYLGFDNSFDWPNIDGELASHNKYCYGLRQQIAVLSDGRVVPCCLDYDGNNTLGNLLESDIEAILASQKARDIYNGFSNNIAVMPLCQKCTYDTSKNYRIPTTVK